MGHGNHVALPFVGVRQNGHSFRRGKIEPHATQHVGDRFSSTALREDHESHGVVEPMALAAGAVTPVLCVLLSNITFRFWVV